MKNLVVPTLASVLLTLALGAGSLAAGPIELFRTGPELVVRLKRFDLLRQANAGLFAELQLRGQGKEKSLRIDLSDAAVDGTLVMDLSTFGDCSGIRVTVKNAAGKTVAETTASPVEDVPLESRFSASAAGPFAFIEPGTAMSAATAGSHASGPKIRLPAEQHLRTVRIAPPDRSLTKQEITFPVMTASEAPLRGGFVLSRQSAAPKDPTKASLYISYKKAIYDGARLARWQKFLVEIPVQESWGKGRGDEHVNLGDDVHVHVTDEVKEKDWRGTQRNILGEGDDDLGQTLSAVDEEGRIYFIAEYRVVRFDPNTKKFECSPPFSLQKLCPGGDVMKGSPGWLSGNWTMVCTRGRVFLVDILDYKTAPQQGTDVPQRRIGGIFSISQDWRDAKAFGADVRLHAGTWETAEPTLYKAAPVVGAALDERKLGKPTITEAGLWIAPAGKKSARGPWRLDLDDQGNNRAFGEVDSLSDVVSKDGTVRFAPTREATVCGVSKTMVHLVGNVYGRHLVGYAGTDGLEIPRASIRQLLMSDGWDASMLLPTSSRHAYRTYAGAPDGTVTVKYQVVEKIQANPAAQGPLADSLKGGPSLGPVFLVTPIPGEPDKAAAVSEYAIYPLSTLDFSRLEDQRLVLKTALPAKAALAVGLGAYDSAWVKQGDEQWLYVAGYTGMTRIKYSQANKVLDVMTSDMFHARLAATPIDRHARGGLKQYDRILPAVGGRLIDSGTGRPGRGGTPFTTGLELFDPKLLQNDSSAGAVPSQTTAYMNRCCGALGTLQSRLIWNAHDGSPRQEIFGTGAPNPVFVEELGAADKAILPRNLDEKVFCYDVTENEGLRDLFGFSLPRAHDGENNASYLAISPCRRFLLILTQDARLYSYAIAAKQFVDGVRLRTPAGDAVATIGFRRPGAHILASPDGGLFFLAAPAGKDGATVQFHRIVVGKEGFLGVEPHLSVECASSDDWQDLENCVRCFMPDLKNNDGSIDFILGWDSKDRDQAKPFVRVIRNFIPPSNEG